MSKCQVVNEEEKLYKTQRNEIKRETLLNSNLSFLYLGHGILNNFKFKSSFLNTHILRMPVISNKSYMLEKEGIC